MAGHNDNNNDRNSEMVPYQPSKSTSLVPLSHSISKLLNLLYILYLMFKI